jgi:hypothetical protein
VRAVGRKAESRKQKAWNKGPFWALLAHKTALDPLVSGELNTTTCCFSVFFNFLSHLLSFFISMKKKHASPRTPVEAHLRLL